MGDRVPTKYDALWPDCIFGISPWHAVHDDPFGHGVSALREASGYNARSPLPPIEVVCSGLTGRSAAAATTKGAENGRAGSLSVFQFPSRRCRFRGCRMGADQP